MLASHGKRAGMVIALTFLLGAPASAQVPDPFARQLARDLAQADQRLAPENYGRAAGPFAGGLREGQTRGFDVTLRAGQDYLIVGVCDARCTQMDIRLRDSSAALVAQNSVGRSTPILPIRPRVTGPHTIEVDMTACADAPCYFAFNVYTR